MMTSFAFIAGLVPLVIATGAGRGDDPCGRHCGVRRNGGRELSRDLCDPGPLCAVPEPAGAGQGLIEAAGARGTRAGGAR